MSKNRSLKALSRRFHQRQVMQLPGRPERLEHYEVGGPEDASDRRLQLNTETLEMLLKVAKASEVGVVVIHQVGLEVSVWRDSNGHRYEQVTILGLAPQPKRVPTGIEMPASALEAFRKPKH